MYIDFFLDQMNKGKKFIDALMDVNDLYIKNRENTRNFIWDALNFSGWLTNEYCHEDEAVKEEITEMVEMNQLEEFDIIIDPLNFMAKLQAEEYACCWAMITDKQRKDALNIANLMLKGDAWKIVFRNDSDVNIRFFSEENIDMTIPLCIAFILYTETPFIIIRKDSKISYMVFRNNALACMTKKSVEKLLETTVSDDNADRHMLHILSDNIDSYTNEPFSPKSKNNKPVFE